MPDFEVLPCFPSSWYDDVRMGSLFSSIRSLDVNPADWPDKRKFWSTLIKDSSNYLQNPVVSVRQLKDRFKRNGVIPRCLSPIVADMHNSKELISIEQFRSGPEGWLSWSVDVLFKRPLSWLMGVSGIWKYDPIEIAVPDNQQFIILELIQEIAEKLVTRHYERDTDPDSLHLVRLSDLRADTMDLCCDALTFDLVLLYLQREHKIAVDDQGNKKVVKFLDRHDADIGRITEADQSVLNLQMMSRTLEKDIELLEIELDRLDKAVREALRLKNKSKALQLLKRKKLLESKCAKKVKSIENLDNMLHQLTESKSQKRIFDAYRSGVNAFKSNLNASGISVDKIDDTMDSVHEALSDHEEISSALGQRLRPSDDFSDDELEAELDALVKDDFDSNKVIIKALPDESDFDIPLPSIPAEMPTSPKISNIKGAATAGKINNRYGFVDNDDIEDGPNFDRLKRLRKELEQS